VGRHCRAVERFHFTASPASVSGLVSGYLDEDHMADVSALTTAMSLLPVRWQAPEQHFPDSALVEAGTLVYVLATALGVSQVVARSEVPSRSYHSPAPPTWLT
jgi:hypothetical protein